MTELDRLPPDQRAVLSLVLDRGKSYGEVAEMLAIPERAVRDRAHAALDALAKDTSSSVSEQAPASARSAARGASPAVQAPARSAAPGASRPVQTSSAVKASSAVQSSATSPPSPPTPPHRDARSALTPSSSRTAGALLLAGIAAVIVVAVILISSGGKGSSHTPATTSSSSQSSTSTTTAAGSKPSLNKTIALTPAEPTLKANGTAYVLSEGSRKAFYISAQGLPASSGFFYAVWLYNSPSSSTPLGRAPNVGSDGRMQGGNPLPSNAGNYHQLILTRETSTHPTHPGPIVLKGTFGLH